MLQVGGQRQFAASADEVRKHLQEMAALVQCVPDLVRVEQCDEQQAQLVVRPGFAFLRGEMQVRLQREPGAPDQEWQWRLEMRGIGSQAQARVRARLESLDPQNSRLHYQVTLEQVGGLLRAVQSSLLQAAMEKTIRDFLDRLEQQLRTHYGSG